MLYENITVNELSEEYCRSVGRKVLLISLLIPGLVILAGVSATMGSSGLSIEDVCYAFLARFLPSQFHSTWFAEMVVWDLRLPRIILGIVGGMSLAVAGAVMQGVLKNPLASEFTLGIASAACFGAALAITMESGLIKGGYIIVGNSFVFSLLATIIIYGLAKYKGASSQTMVLAGIAIMYTFSALTSLLQYAGNAEDVHSVVFWMMGSLDRASWENAGIASIILVCSLPYLITKSWDINAMSCGDESAKSLGIDIDRMRMTSMIFSSLLTASIISFTGTIGFIGLVAPHMTRMVIGGDHRFLLPASGLVGAVLLLSADTVSRTIFSPAVLPVGIITSFIGVPFFIYLFIKRRKAFW